MIKVSLIENGFIKFNYSCNLIIKWKTCGRSSAIPNTGREAKQVKT